MKKLFTIVTLILISKFTYSQNLNQVKKLDSIFNILNNQNQFNGSVLIAEKGNIIYQKGYGIANEKTNKKIDSKTIFELASTSKQFTASGIVLLKRQGKLQYSDKLSKYIPELDFWADVSIYDLIRHTSGIPEFLFDMKEGWDKNKIATNEDLIKFYSSKKDTLGFRPGTKYQYCNTNYALLASIIERASGESYADFLSRNIFKPLKMNNTFVYNRRQKPKNIKNYAIGYYWGNGSFKKVTAEQPEYDDKRVYYLDGIVGHAKINSNVVDLYKWVTTLKSNTFFTKEEFEEMTEITNTSDGKRINYGFGLDISKGDNKFSYGHTGSWDGYISLLYHNQPKDRTIIVLENFTFGTYPFTNIIEILDGKPLSKEFKKKITLSNNQLKKYEGIYIDQTQNNEKHIITIQNGHLIYNSSTIPWDMRFFPISDNEFQGVRQGGMDGVLKFISTDNGKIKLEMTEYGNVIGSGIK